MKKESMNRVLGVLLLFYVILVFIAVVVCYVFITTQKKTLSNIPLQIKTATLIYILVPGRKKGRARVGRKMKWWSSPGGSGEIFILYWPLC